VKKSRPFEDEAMIERSSAGGGGVSPFTSAVPARTSRVITVGSWKPSLKRISFAFAGRQLVFAFQFGLRTRSISLFGW
jgi:hypothetical protein